MEIGKEKEGNNGDEKKKVLMMKMRERNTCGSEEKVMRKDMSGKVE